MLFQYGKPVTGEYFYDRRTMRALVADQLRNKQNFMIKAPRRYGKTSIVKQELQGIDPQHLFINLQMIPRMDLLTEMIVNYAFERVGYRGFLKQLRKNALSVLREIKAISLGNDFLELTIEFFNDDIYSDCDRLVKALDTLDAIAEQTNQTFYVVLDEFQEIGRFTCEGDILNLLRSVMQMHNHVCYVFLGSKPTLMTKIFENKKSPFYNFGRKLTLKPFDLTELHGELIAAFKKIKIVFRNKDELTGLLERTEGHPANTMIVMQNLERLAKNKELTMIDKDLLDTAYEEAYEEMQDLIAEYLSEIRSKEHLHDVIYREANNEAQVLGSSALAQKRKTLEEMGHIEKKGRGKYRIVDGFLKEALIRTRNALG